MNKANKVVGVIKRIFANHNSVCDIGPTSTGISYGNGVRSMVMTSNVGECSEKSTENMHRFETSTL